MPGLKAVSTGLVRRLWFARSRLPVLRLPLPCRLPYGGWFLAYGDYMGFNVFSRNLHPRPLGGGEWEFVSRFLKSGMTVFDIGANQGFCTLLAAARVGSEGKVIAFEPAPTECRKLRANLRLNRFRNVLVEPIALGSREGVTDFHLCLDHQGSFSSIRRQAPDVTARTELIKVPITTLDCYVQRAPLSSLHLIKIDAEGGELDILKGATGTLSSLRPVIIAELAEVRTRQWGYAASEIYSLVADHGYQWFQTTSEGGLRAAPKKECYEPEQNLVAVPNERSGLVVESETGESEHV